MEIYFAASIAGGRQYLEVYQKMVGFLLERGHRIPTQHIIAPDVLDLESQLTAEGIYTRDMQWLERSDAMIAEVSNPSLGVGYEIACALQFNKPVLCLYQPHVFLSRLILGNTHPMMRIQPYATDAEWQQHMIHFLS
jgi:2'-deoxynucleoside 5'-phosphate N-hydrolase